MTCPLGHLGRNPAQSIRSKLANTNTNIALGCWPNRYSLQLRHLSKCNHVSVDFCITSSRNRTGCQIRFSKIRFDIVRSHLHVGNLNVRITIMLRILLSNIHQWIVRVFGRELEFCPNFRRIGIYSGHCDWSCFFVDISNRQSFARIILYKSLRGNLKFGTTMRWIEAGLAVALGIENYW